MQKNDGEHGVLEGVLVAIQLTEDCAEIDVGVCQSLRVILLEFQFESLDEIGESSSHLASSPVVAGQVVIGGSL